MRRRALLTLLLVTVAASIVVFMGNAVVSNAMVWASAPDPSERLEALTRGLAWIGAAGLLLIVALAIASWLATGRFRLQRIGSLTSFARSFPGLQGLNSRQRRVAVSLALPSFIVLDIGLGFAIWSITRANLTVWASSPVLPELLATVAAQLILLVSAATFILIQITFVRMLGFRARTETDQSPS